jgi:hypothetical protein
MNCIGVPSVDGVAVWAETGLRPAINPAPMAENVNI